MRAPTESEIRQINEVAKREFDYEFNPDYIGVIDAYMPDGPSYCGKVAMVLGGECCLVSVFTWRKVVTDDYGTTRIECMSGEIS